MKNKKKVWMVSFICVGAGIVLLILGLVLGGRPGYYIDRNGIHSAAEGYSDEAVTGKKELDAFQDIEISVDDADIEIVPSDKYAVEYCLTGSGGKPQIVVENGKLTLKEGSRGKILNFYIGEWDYGQRQTVSYYVKLYMPLDKEYNRVLLDSDYGDISVPELTAESVRLDSDDGDISAAQISASSLQVDNEYGDIVIEKFEGKQFTSDQQDGELAVAVLNAEQVRADNEYGSITVRSGKGKSLVSDMDDGDFTAELLDYEKISIQNEYGDVTVGLPDAPSEYALYLETEYGQIGVDGYHISGGDDEVRYRMEGTNGRQVKVVCDDGNIILTQKK